MGMLITCGFILAMDTFGPISDNAGGVAEMSGSPEHIRRRTDKLDCVGNTTKALTKGYAVGTAGLATFLLFRAFLDEVADYTGDLTVKDVNLGIPEVFVSGLLGVMVVIFFASLAMTAVGSAAQVVITEVRRQFQEMPGILQNTEQPDYDACVAIVTSSALKEMILPGILVVLSPIVLGLIMRGLGEAQGSANLAIPCLAAFLMTVTMGGVNFGLFLNNAGGAWDNAKKLVATDKAFGGKHGEAHRACVTGDTVGDPCKDTAGPSLHVLVKLISTITLVWYPLFVNGK
jgi:K(+)-stimulated pyrophosphate-energized sodium pump